MAAKRNAHRQSLWDVWEVYKNKMGEINTARISNIFEDLKRAACAEFMHSAARFARLGSSDEEAFDNLYKLMEAYQRVIDIGSQHSQDTLLAGVCEVLTNSVKDFNDATSEYGQLNPVREEKRDIVSDAMAKLCADIDTIKTEFITRFALHPLQGHDGIKNDCMTKIHTYYEKNLCKCITQLNSLHTRSAASQFTGIWEREWEELGNIIKVQITAIGQNSANQEAMQMLDILRNILLQLTPSATTLLKLLHLPPERNNVSVEYEFFAAALGGVFDLHAGQEADTEGFLQLLDEEAKHLLAPLHTEIKKSTYQTQRALSGDKMLANDMVKIFAQLQLPTTVQDSPQTEILRGITETIAIKIESLQESISDFDAEIKDALLCFAASSPTPQEINVIIEHVRAAWFSKPPTKDNLSTFFAELWHDQPLEALAARTKRAVTTSTNKLEKLALRFKKDSLLHEVCTYEDILTHSVPRLADSEEETEITAADILHNTYATLQTLLRKNNIEQIHPAPHSMFNAFEHEVLVAEQTEGFNKGEIVKVMNTGYKQHDTVIVRANVVAAR